MKRWRSNRRAAWVESVYCQRCGDAARCGCGIIVIGPWTIVGLIVGSFVLLPLVWSGPWWAYPLVFVGMFVLIAVTLTRTFFWLFRNHPQVRG